MATNKGYRKNVEQIAFHDLNGNPGFQMAMQVVKGTSYLYLTGRRLPGWHIMDVTNPEKPRYVRFVDGPPNTSTLKLQVADGIMVTQLQGKVEGIYIWDVKTDPENPKFLSHWSTGVPAGYPHRFFYNGGRYVHLTANCRGFVGFIYRIIDIQDPTHPVEVGRWWRQEQWIAGITEAQKQAMFSKEISQNLNTKFAFHGPPYPKGNMVYCGQGGAGLIILDISDITLPQKVGQLNHHPPFAGGMTGAWCHTILPLYPLNQRDKFNAPIRLER